MYVIVFRSGGADASGDRTELYGPFYDLESAHDFGHSEFKEGVDDWGIYMVHKPKPGGPYA